MTAKVKVEEKEEPSVSNAKKTCFVVMPIADMHGYDSGHFARVYEYLIKPALLNCGYSVERADDTVKSDYIVIGIVQKIIQSDLVICDLSGRNPNVMYELGIRHAFDKPVVLIKDKLTEKVFDIQGLRYYEYDQTLRIDSVNKDLEKISASITETPNDNSESVNSMVRLASIHSATLPDKTNISPDTQILLDAINRLQNRVFDIELASRNNEITSAFACKGKIVIFKNKSYGKSGDVVFGEHGNTIGKIVDVGKEFISIVGHDGTMTLYDSSSNIAREFSTRNFASS